MAAVLDEAMGATAWLSKYSVVAAQIKVDFEKMLPIGGVAYLEAGLKKHSGRKVWLEAKLMNSKQEVYSRSVGLFIVLDKKKFAAWLEAPTPKSRPRVKRQRLP
jgi:acyl-coenzyme A thioesterase PaaI-like protein